MANNKNNEHRTSIGGQAIIEGVMMRGPVLIKNVYYNLGEEGYVKEGWVTWNTYKYYNNSQGRPYVSCKKTIDGVTYTFDENGVVVG